MADQSASTRERVALILDSIEYAFGITILILFTVFAWDVSEGWFPKIWDVRIEAAMTVVIFLFIVELGLMIYAVNRWWLDVSFWLCFIATGAMLFELPWATQALFGVKVVAAAGVANLRLHKIFRVMARIGRLLRIIKILLVSRFKMVVSYLFKTKTDSDLDQKVRLAKQRLSVSSKGRIWQSLEALSTFGIMGIFALLYVLAIFTIGSLSPDRSAERTLGAIVRLNAEQVIRFMPTYLESFPEVLYLQVDGNVFADNSRKIAALRDKEIDKRSLTRGELWLDISSFSKKQARSFTALTALLIFSISVIVVFINWVITRFSFSISGALKTLAQALDERDPYTRLHSKNVAELAERTAAELGMRREKQRIIRIAGELHDIGKIGVPEKILQKKSRLSADELERMRMHPARGAYILEPLTVFESVILTVLHHHERYDGSGYPAGLKGDTIPRMAQILAVCDVWDALTTDRPYRPAISRDAAKQIIVDGSGTEFDAKVVEAFFRIVERPDTMVAGSVD